MKQYGIAALNRLCGAQIIIPPIEYSFRLFDNHSLTRFLFVVPISFA
jgi:hypothetical protein